jgi:hypothetical protein
MGDPVQQSSPVQSSTVGCPSNDQSSSLVHIQRYFLIMPHSLIPSSPLCACGRPGPNKVYIPVIDLCQPCQRSVCTTLYRRSCPLPSALCPLHISPLGAPRLRPVLVLSSSCPVLDCSLQTVTVSVSVSVSVSIGVGAANPA